MAGAPCPGGFQGLPSLCLPILGRRHLESVLRSYVQHYNRERPHRGLALRPLEAPQTRSPTGGAIQRRDHLGGRGAGWHRRWVTWFVALRVAGVRVHDAGARGCSAGRSSEGPIRGGGGRGWEGKGSADPETRPDKARRPWIKRISGWKGAVEETAA